MNVLRKIAIVFVPIYWLITWLYHQLYNIRFLKSTKFDHPVICVGNLAVGGTGKTPMIEYLISLLSKHYKIAILSRGYKRKTSGFLMADNTASAELIGDEPFQIFKKFNDVIVAVDEQRKRGITKLIQLNNKPDVVLLDDAFQHRKVRAGLSILLTSYNDLYCNDMLLPTGNLREPANGANRADVIVVTKCPDNLDDTEKQHINKELKLKPYQSLFFSTIRYESTLINGLNSLNLVDLKGKEFTLLTGIANPKPMVKFLKDCELTFEHLEYPDHHFFTASDIDLLKTKSLIITTEKDFVRLQGSQLHHDNLYYLPMAIQIDSEKSLNKIVTDYINTTILTQA